MERENPAFIEAKIKAEVRSVVMERLREAGIDPKQLKRVSQKYGDSETGPITILRMEFFGIRPALVVNVPGRH